MQVILYPCSTIFDIRLTWEIILNVRKYLTTGLTLAILASLIVTPAEAASEKKLTSGQAKVIYEKALKATSTWMDKNSFEVTTINSFMGETRSIDRIRRDSAKRIETFYTDEGVATYIGSQIYLTMNDSTLVDFERELAVDNGLNLTAKFARVNAAKLGVAAESRENLIKDAKPEFYGSIFSYVNENTKYCTIKSVGKDQIIYCKFSFDNFLGDPAKPVDEHVVEQSSTISSGKLVKEVAVYDGKEQIVTTYKAFKGSVKAPSGPYLEYDIILDDPRYERAESVYQAQRALFSLVREASAIAAFENKDHPSAEDWKVVAKEQGLKLYDRGIGFEIEMASSGVLEVCGVFTDEGARLETASCASLGFVEL